MTAKQQAAVRKRPRFSVNDITRTPPLPGSVARQRLQLLAHELISERLPAKWGKAVAYLAAAEAYALMVRIIHEELGRERQ